MLRGSDESGGELKTKHTASVSSRNPIGSLDERKLGYWPSELKDHGLDSESNRQRPKQPWNWHIAVWDITTLVFIGAIPAGVGVWIAWKYHHVLYNGQLDDAGFRLRNNHLPYDQVGTLRKPGRIFTHSSRSSYKVNTCLSGSLHYWV